MSLPRLEILFVRPLAGWFLLGLVTACGSDTPTDGSASVSIASLTFTPDSFTVNRHDQFQLHWDARDLFGRRVTRAGSVHFASSNSELATVAADGSVTAGGQSGSVEIIAAGGGQRVVIAVTVTQIPAVLRISPLHVVIRPGGATQLNPTLLDRRGDPIDVSALTFDAESPALFTISPTGHLVSSWESGSGVVRVSIDSLVREIGVFVGDESPGFEVELRLLSTDGYQAELTPGGRMVISGGVIDSLALGDLTDFTLATQVAAPEGAFGLALDHAGTRAYFGTFNTRIGVFDLISNTRLPDIARLGGDICYAVAISPNDQRLYVGTATGVYRIDLATGQALDSLNIFPALFLAVDPIHPRLFASVDEDSVKEILLGDTMTLGRTFGVAAARGIAVSSDGSTLYAASARTFDLQQWDLSTGLRTRSAGLHGESGFGVAVGSNRIAVTAGDNHVMLFDRATLAPLNSILVRGSPTRPAWDASGTTLVVPATGGAVEFIQ